MATSIIQLSKARQAVKKVYDECGIIDPIQLPLEVIINSRNVMIKEERIEGSDGRIIMNDHTGIITINSTIENPARRRFILAHELGHFELHRHLKKGFADDSETLSNWYQSSYASEEIEANEFASEFLMPAHLFYNECKGKVFNHTVIEHLANRFQVSKTAAILKFAKKNNGNHPIFIACCQDNKMKWFAKSDDWIHYSSFKIGLPPPDGSVASEVFQKGSVDYENNKSELIWKSTWFPDRSNQSTPNFYEYCLYIPSLRQSLSVLWEK